MKKRVLVHSFNMADVEDPDLYVAQPLYAWQQTEQGQWVMQHAVEEPVFYYDHDQSSFGYHVRVYAVLADRDITFFELKYGRNP